MARNSAQQQLRSRIAHHAARLMAQDGIQDFAFAKRKAARELGVADARQLPDNEEIEHALRAYHALYQKDEHPARLKRLRQAALGAMELLKRFQPYLTGPVLSGSAGREADVSLHLFTDSVKDVELFLLNRGIPYRSAQRRFFVGDGPQIVPTFTFEFDDAGINASVFSSEDVRKAVKTSKAGKQVERARREAVSALVAES